MNKTKCEYRTVSTHTLSGLKQAERLQAQGWKMGSSGLFTVQFYRKINMKKVMTYKDVLNILEASKPSKGLFVAVIYDHKDTHEWLPIDKNEYIRQLQGIGNPEIPYPCYFEIEPDGEMFIHPRMKNG